MDSKQCEFNNIMTKIQPCYGFKENPILKTYFSHIYDDLIKKNSNSSISKYEITNFFNLSNFISSRLIVAFNQMTNGQISNKNFVDSLLIVFFGKIEEILKFTFTLFDFKKSGFICKSDVKFFFLHLHVEFIEDHKLSNVFEMIDQLFCQNESEIDLNTYSHKIKTNNSDILYYLLNYIYMRQPFNKDVFKFLDKYYEFDFSSKLKEKEKISSELEDSQELIVTPFQINQQTTKPLFDNQNTLAILDRSLNTTCASSNQKPNSNIQAKVYKINKKQKLTKYKVVFMENHLFSFKKSVSKKGYVLDNFHLVKNTIPCKVLDFFLENTERVIYPMTFLASNGANSIENDKIYFFKFKEERDEFINNIKDLMNSKKFSDNYKILFNLERGHISKVKLGIKRQTKQKVAVKIIKKSKLTKKNVTQILDELDVIRFLINHPHNNVIKFIEINEDEESYYIIMEYISHGNLQKLIQEKNSNLEESYSIIHGISNGLKFLHELGIIHRDIKPDNILICRKNSIEVKIIDFGFSKILSENEKTNESYGTFIYSAPEIIMGNFYNKNVDIWSLGVIIFYLTFGYLPYDKDGMSLKEIAKTICENELVFKVNCPKYFEDLIRSCCCRDGDKRYNIYQVINALSSWIIDYL